MSASGTDRLPVLRSGGYRWVLATVGFTIATCLVVASGALTLFLISEHGGRLIGSERTRSLLALGAFIAVVAVPAYLLVVAARTVQ